MKLLPNVYPGSFRFVPAAYYASNAAGLGLYVRYKKSSTKEVVVRSRDAKHIWFDTPDRELLLVRMTHSHPIYPSEGTFDEFVNLNFYQEGSARDLGFDYYMTNYIDYMGKESGSPRNRRVREPGSMTIISDSGGFQFLTGKLDYLDPLQLVAWYNENADVGIVLDMPIASQIIDPKLSKALAQLQGRNTAMMLGAAVPGLEFMNVVHGANSEAKLKYHEHVVDSRIRRLAIGGSYFETVLSSVASALVLHRGLGAHYQHYHFLGVTNLFQVIAYLRMAHLKLLPFITSDSSTYYQKGASKEYLIQTRMTSNISHLNIGQRDNVTTSRSLLPCSCPLCSRVKYTDVLSNFGGSAVSSATAFHNAYRYNEYLKAMADVIDMPLPKLAKLLERQLGKRPAMQEGIKTLQFIDTVAESGLDKALAKYRYYLSGTSYIGEDKRSAVVSGFDQQAQAAVIDKDKVVERAQFLIGQYANAPAESQLKREKQKGKKIMSSKGKKRTILKTTVKT